MCGKALSPAQEGSGTRQKKKSKILTCAEKPGRRCKRTVAHVKKKKQGFDVCGAAASPVQESGGTRQKGKA
ncbi:MAG TPA: hypothetical protein DEO89_05975, partial [Lachnospiraceae bacterium]|nr:hypothetical protein [Lachnospiraceae bacterium]